MWLQFSINWYRAKASGPVLIPVLRDHRCVPRYQREYYIQLSLFLSPLASPFTLPPSPISLISPLPVLELLPLSLAFFMHPSIRNTCIPARHSSPLLLVRPLFPRSYFSRTIFLALANINFGTRATAKQRATFLHPCSRLEDLAKV